MASKPKIIVIVGPTASGKTSLSIKLAKAIGGEIVSADSRQVYKELNLGTGKVTEREMAGIPHHLLDVANPKRVYTASNYVKQARTAISQIQKRGNIPIICGGTGFYIDTLLGRMNIPEVPPNKMLRKKLEKLTAEQMFKLLSKKDPERAKEIDRQNPVRLIRALEIVEALGKVPKQKIVEPYDALILGVSVEQKKLQENIHVRLLSRIKLGMLREAKKLHAEGLSWKRMEDLGLEYRYMALHLQGIITKEEMLTQLESEIIKYSKRQMTWFKRHKDVVWVDVKEFGEIKRVTKKFLGK